MSPRLKLSFAAALTFSLAGLLPAVWWLGHFAGGEWVLSKDTIDFFYVIKRWAWDRLLRGEMPLWNEGLFTGIYQLASPALAVFSPVTAVFYCVFDSFRAEEYQLPFFAALAGLGAYRLAREIALDREQSLLIAVIYGLCGPLLSLADRSPYFFAAALYPLFLFSVARFRRDRAGHLLAGLGIAFFLGLIVINGDWVGALFVSLTFPACWLLKSGRAHTRDLGRLWPLALCFGLIAVSVWPVFENLSESTRSEGLSFQEASYFSFHPLRIFSFFMPELWGQPYDGSFWGQGVSNGIYASRFWFHSLYLGSVAGVLGGLGIFAPSCRRWKLPLIAALLLTLGIGFGSYGFLHGFLYDHVHLYRGIRFPEKFILFSVLCWFLLALLGLRETVRRERWTLFLGLLGAWHFAALVALLFFPDASELASRYGLSATSAAAASGRLASGLIVHLGCATVAGVLLLPQLTKFRIWALTAMTCAELAAFAPALHWVDGSGMRQPSAFAPEMRKAGGRYLRDELTNFEGDRRLILLSDWPVLDGLNNVFGYDALVPPRMALLSLTEIFGHLDIWSRVLNIRSVISTISPREPNLKLFAERGLLRPVQLDPERNMVLLERVRAAPAPVPAGASDPASDRASDRDDGVELFATASLAHGAAEALQQVLRRGATGGPAILEDDQPLPASSDEALHANWKRLAGGHAYSVTTNQPALLVERDAYSAGWQASVDGQRVDVRRADLVSRAVVIPAGTHEVVFQFHPPLFWWALRLSVFSAAVFLGLLFFGVWKRFAERCQDTFG